MEKEICVIFDMDGLIFDSEKIWKDTSLICNKKFNINMDDKFRLCCCGRGESETIAHMQKLFPHIDAKLVRAEWGRLVQETVDTNGVPLKKGFKTLLKFLQKKKIRIALVTGSTRAEVEKYFSMANMDANKIFSVIVPIDDVKKGKPNPEGYILAVKRLGQKAENCFVVEDSPNGAGAGLKAGCKVFLVPDVFAPTQQIRNRCTVCDSLLQVKERLEKII